MERVKRAKAIEGTSRALRNSTSTTISRTLKNLKHAKEESDFKRVCLR